jgi:transcriptional regulator with XRE-family HTH domain
MKEQILIYFGERVRKERLKQKLTQEKLAEIAGLHRTYIGMIERGEKNITLTNIEKIAKALDITIEDIFQEEHI